MDIETLEWSQENLAFFGVKETWLPKIIKNSSDDFGKVLGTEFALLADVPITGVLGD